MPSWMFSPCMLGRWIIRTLLRLHKFSPTTQYTFFAA